MKTAIHFTDNYLINPPNPILVNLIGVGGTGGPGTFFAGKNKYITCSIGPSRRSCKSF